MEVELLVVPDCPNEAPAAHLLRRALDEVGLSATRFATVVVTRVEDAEKLGFTGSPTILIDGVDPFAEPGRPAALACRMYRTATGLAGTPDPADLRQVLSKAVRPLLRCAVPPRGPR